MDARIEDYLDHVCAPLIGVVPYEQRQELRTELRGHLEALAVSYQELGRPPAHAVRDAVRQFGDPQRLVAQWKREWLRSASRTSERSWLRGSMWRPLIAALFCFGTAAFLAFIQLLRLDQIEISYGMDVSLPTWEFECLTLGLLPPLFAGLLTGLIAPARAALGTFLAVALLVLPPVWFSLYLPVPDFIARPMCFTLLALIQALGWIPIGCGAAALGSFLRTRPVLPSRRWVLQ